MINTWKLLLGWESARSGLIWILFSVFHWSFGPSFCKTENNNDTSQSRFFTRPDPRSGGGRRLRGLRWLDAGLRGAGSPFDVRWTRVRWCTSV